MSSTPPIGAQSPILYPQTAGRDPQLDEATSQERILEIKHKCLARVVVPTPNGKHTYIPGVSGPLPFSPVPGDKTEQEPPQE